MPVEGPPPPGPVRDVVAWIVSLTHQSKIVEFAIDDAIGEVVRIMRSR